MANSQSGEGSEIGEGQKVNALLPDALFFLISSGLLLLFLVCIAGQLVDETLGRKPPEWLVEFASTIRVG